MKSFFISCLFLGTINIVAGQNYSSQNPEYISMVTAGEQALKEAKYDSCLTYYRQAFAIKQSSYLSTMRMAACAFLSGDLQLASRQLDIAFEIDWSGSRSILNNYPEFGIVRDTEFAELVNQRWREAAEAAGIDVPLMLELEEIHQRDQVHRQGMRDFAWGSPSMDSLINLMVRDDSINTARIVEIIEQYGYPGKSLVGEGQSTTAFLVIQHAELAVQEKYLELITDAADAGEVPWSAVALLIDRVNLRQGKKQIYGSQVHSDSTGAQFFGPIEQPFKVDSIRATVGLGPLQEYAQRFGFDWDPEAHIRRSAGN